MISVGRGEMMSMSVHVHVYGQSTGLGNIVTWVQISVGVVLPCLV